MATSFVDICNQALIDIGAATILDLTEDTKAAKLCNLVYKNCRDYVLRQHPWNSAMTRVVLSPLASAPAYGYSYAFVFPSDCIRVWDLDGLTDFRKEGQGIVCNETTVNMRYVRRIEDATLLADDLATAISCYIAYKIAYAMTESSQLKKDMFAAYKDALRKAKFVDSTEDPSPQFEDDVWLQARLTGSSASVNRMP